MDDEETMECHFLIRGILVGASSTGKTSLIADRFSKIHEQTIGCDITFKMFNIQDQSIKLQLFDTAGEERFQFISTSYLRDQAFAIVMFDLFAPATLHSAKNWINIIRHNSCNRAIHVVLVGNKLDVGPTPFCSGALLAETMRVSYAEVSVMNQTNVSALFHNIIQTVLDQRHEYDDHIHGIRLGTLHEEHTINHSLSIEDSYDKPKCCIIL